MAVFLQSGFAKAKHVMLRFGYYVHCNVRRYMCDVLLDVGDFFTLLKRWPMNSICLKTAENNFHELDIMGAYPRKHSTCCKRKISKR